MGYLRKEREKVGAAFARDEPIRDFKRITRCCLACQQLYTGATEGTVGERKIGGKVVAAVARWTAGGVVLI